jgi:LPXTG-motif cell wall-anchored protein
MSEDFSEDFVLEEEEEGANRSFLILAGALIGVFILIVGCVLVFLLLQRGERQDAIAKIESENATTEAGNALVTQTVQALQTEAARPTDTPTIEPTATATATPVPPTDTPVVQQPTAVVTEELEPSPTATSALAGGGSIAPTTVPGNSGGGSETLPQTGFSAWALVVGAIGLMAVLLVARRLRTG